VTIPTAHASELRTPLCDLLGIRYPIVQAGMAGSSTPDLVAAVSNAGGLGILGAALMTPDKVREAIRAIKARTNRPFGVNFQFAPPEVGPHSVREVQKFLDSFRRELGLPLAVESLPPAPAEWNDQVGVALQERVPVLSIGLGDPGPLTHAAHDAGVLVMVMVSTVEEAARVANGGADIVVAQGAEAGGHRSTFELGPGGEVPLVGTLALVPQVVDAVSVPVLAAGGIMDGRGLVAALALGAAGALLGTRFLAAPEGGVPAGYQRRLLEATEVDAVVTNVYTGRPARGVRNRFMETYTGAGAPTLPWPLQRMAAADIYAAARARDDPDYYLLLAGQGLRLFKRIQPAAEIVQEIADEAISVLRKLRDLH